MTPRTVVFAFPETQSVAETIFPDSRLFFSRIPIYGENLDDVKGFVLKSEIFQAASETPEKPLSELRRPIIVVSGDLTLHDLFERMMNGSTHIALVIDSYGGTEGVVTMEDFIETLLGLEIIDEVDTVEDMQEIARRQWEKRAQRSGLLTDAPEPGDGNNSPSQKKDI